MKANVRATADWTMVSIDVARREDVTLEPDGALD